MSLFEISETQNTRGIIIHSLYTLQDHIPKKQP